MAKGREWTALELEYLRDNPHLTLNQLAVELNRSPQSIAQRRAMMKKNGDLDQPTKLDYLISLVEKLQPVKQASSRELRKAMEQGYGIHKPKGEIQESEDIFGHKYLTTKQMSDR